MPARAFQPARVSYVTINKSFRARHKHSPENVYF